MSLSGVEMKIISEEEMRLAISLNGKEEVIFAAD